MQKALRFRRAKTDLQTFDCDAAGTRGEGVADSEVRLDISTVSGYNGAMITHLELFAKMKIEILADVENGIVPTTVASFSELHDYVDANLYGGMETLLEEIDSEAEDTDAGHSGAMQSLCKIANHAIEAVDAWIKAGGIAAGRRIEGNK